MRISVVSLLLGSLLAAAPAQAAIFVVDTTGDGVDNGPGDGVCRTAGPPPRCTLRAAIMEANALAGFDTINFNIAPAGAKTITPASALPSILSRVTIDGTTQPGWVAAPIIELNAASAGALGALSLAGGSSFSTIRGLDINRSPGIAIRVFSSNNVIVGNYLGTDLTGTVATANAAGVYSPRWEQQPNRRHHGRRSQHHLWQHGRRDPDRRREQQPRAGQLHRLECGRHGWPG